MTPSNDGKPVLKNFASNGLKINTHIDGHTAIMNWLGQSDSRNPGAELNPYLDSLVEEMEGLELTINFADLEYMNSSTVSPIIQFLKKLNAQEIQTEVTYKAASKWQSASFKALETFSKILNCLKVKGI